jgi:hypothetical protein
MLLACHAVPILMPPGTSSPDLYLSQGRKAFNPHFTAQTNMAAAASFPGGAVVQPLRKLLGSNVGVPVLIMVVTVYGLGVDWRLAFVLATLCKPPPDWLESSSYRLGG